MDGWCGEALGIDRHLSLPPSTREMQSPSSRHFYDESHGVPLSEILDETGDSFDA